MRVSVIMSVYDGVSLTELNEAVYSILSQTLNDFEFLVLKDGVTRPDLLGFLEAIQRSDPRVRLLSSEHNCGIACSLNQLIVASRGEFIARMDADDVSLPIRLESQVNFLESEPSVDMVGTFAEEVDATGTHVFNKCLPTDSQSIRTFMGKRDPFIHPTVMFRRRFFDKVGHYNENPDYSYLEDTELWSRAILGKCELANIPSFLLKFRVNQSFYTRRRGPRFIWNEFILRAKYIQRAGLPFLYIYAPLGVMLIRCCPPWMLRWAYMRFRTYTNAGKDPRFQENQAA